MAVLTKDDVSKIIEKISNSGKFRLIDYDLVDKSKETLGYLGQHLILTLNLSSEAGNTRKRFFVKTYEVKDGKEDFLGETGIFKREQDFYKIVVEDMKECTGGLDWCPDYIFSKERVLVLEDLSHEGFKMMAEQGRWALDDIHLKVTLATLASMHATSLWLEQQISKTLPAVYPTIFQKEMLYDENKPEMSTRKWITWQILDLLEGVDYLEKYTCEEKNLIKNNFREQIMRIYSLSKISEKYQNVLIHGDLWKNNLLFLYSLKGVPTQCKLVDFQFIRYAPPAHDVMHLLHYATTKEDRDRKESNFLDFYYESFKKRAEDIGMNVEKKISREEFWESCKEYKELALIQTLLSVHYIMGPATLTVEAESYQKYEEYFTNHRKYYVKNFFQHKSYSEKVKDIFQELIDSYIIKK